jgi:hypothetical protein
MTREPIPRPVLIYGLLGLIPFLAPAAVAGLRPAWAGPALGIEAAYAALIISFLGGARWGLAIGRPAPGLGTTSLSMLPTLAALALLSLPGPRRYVQLVGLATVLVLQWVWDLRASASAPPWFARLRTLLTVGAVCGLLGAALSAS